MLDLLKLSSPVIAAPMCGISDYPFRQLNRELGIGLTYTEMISSVGISRGNKKSLSFTFVKGEHPVVVQLFGDNPFLLAEAAQLFENEGADAIDVNFGCSVKKVIKQGAGSALQRNLSLSKDVLCAVRKAIQIPLFIKCRLGWSRPEENYLELAKIAESEGVNALCLHPRYATQLFTGESNWEHFYALREACTIPLIGSGDIKTSQQITQALHQYPVDAVMLGRGLVGNPWLLTDFLGAAQPSSIEILRHHADLLLDYYPEQKACALLRKYVAKYTKGHPKALALRLFGNTLSCAKDINLLLDMMHV